MMDGSTKHRTGFNAHVDPAVYVLYVSHIIIRNHANKDNLVMREYLFTFKLRYFPKPNQVVFVP